jgi:hypothetical protein
MQNGKIVAGGLVPRHRGFDRLDVSLQYGQILWGNENRDAARHARLPTNKAGAPLDSLVTLCDATQQLHLDLPSWWNDWNTDFEKRRRARGV